MRRGRNAIADWRRTGGAILIGTLLPVLLGCRSQHKEPAPSEPGAVFVEAAAETGLQFRHFAGATGKFYLNEIMGPGVAVLDYDGDGDQDVFLVQGGFLDSQSAANSRFPVPQTHWPGNRLYRNELVPSGRLTFTDVTEAAGVAGHGYGLGVAVGDYDGDGDPDLYVTNYGPNTLFRNNGDGTFTDVTSETASGGGLFSGSAAFLDYDRDGDLDLFVTQYNTFTPRANKKCTPPRHPDMRDYCGPTVYFPLPDHLLENQGGHFVDVSRKAGIASASGNGLGVVCADFDSDGWIDIYVANDQTPNRLWRNRGDGTFEDVGLMSGSAYNGDGEVEAGMGVTAGDFDGDGDFDLFLSHLRGQTNTLYRNDGRAGFNDVTAIFGLARVSLPFTGFGTRWFDYDNDGLLDLFVANGAVMLLEDLKGDPFPYGQKNQLFHNGGKRFTDASAGSAFELAEVSRGAAFADIDNDGDIDIVVANCNGPARLLLNQIGNRNHWLSVRLRGSSANRDGIGAKIALERRGMPLVWRRVSTGGSYLSASDVRAHFGLGDDDAVRRAPVESILVVWPGGQKERWPQRKTDCFITLTEGTGTPESS